MTFIEWLTVAALTGFSTICAEYAKDLKRYVNAKVKAWVEKRRR